MYEKNTASLQWQGGSGLDFAEHQTGIDSRHTGDRRQPFDRKAFKVFSVADGDLEQVIVLTGDMVTLQHLGHFTDRVLETLYLLGLVQLQADVNETKHIIANRLSIQERSVSTDDAQFFQALGARQGCRWRELNLARQLNIADTPFALQDFQDIQIGVIQ